MNVRDILLQASSYPLPTPDWAFTLASEIATQCEAQLSLGICKVHIPPMTNWLANALLDFDATIAEENRKSSDNVEALIATFASHVPSERRGEVAIIDTPGTVSPWLLAIKARAHDIIIVPVTDHSGGASLIEGLVFEAGRPILILPHPTDRPHRGFEHITIAWDGSRVAARALADALPFCQHAKTVSIAQVSDEKDLSKTASIDAVVRHLALHGMTAETRLIAAQKASAADALLTHCREVGSDLLVMGAFGHSRARQFILGGVTRSVLEMPELPVLISH